MKLFLFYFNYLFSVFKGISILFFKIAVYLHWFIYLTVWEGLGVWPSEEVSLGVGSAISQYSAAFPVRSFCSAAVQHHACLPAVTFLSTLKPNKPSVGCLLLVS